VLQTLGDKMTKVEMEEIFRQAEVWAFVGGFSFFVSFFSLVHVLDNGLQVNTFGEIDYNAFAQQITSA
jgi:hypothetical protein